LSFVDILPFETNFKLKTMAINKNDKSSWAIGGTTLIGLGIGLFFLQTSPIWFVACLIAGIGCGLVLTAILSSKNA